MMTIAAVDGLLFQADTRFVFSGDAARFLGGCGDAGSAVEVSVHKVYGSRTATVTLRIPTPHGWTYQYEANWPLTKLAEALHLQD